VSWVTDIWKIVETVASLTKEVERLNAENKDLRSDLNSLTLTVSDLRTELKHQKETATLVLDGYRRDMEHSKESIGAKFDVLTTRLDSKVQDFERRMPAQLPEFQRTLTPGGDN
jgi:chromosome segregation ATPase